MTDQPTTIATPGLDLVPLRIADADEMVEVLVDPGLYTFTGGRPPARGELLDRYAEQVGGSRDTHETWRNWIVRERSSGAAIGFVQATITGEEAGRIAEIAWLIGVHWQGRGYATEAALGLVAWIGQAGVREVIAHVHPDHAASAAVAERIGLERTEVIVDGERRWRRVLDGSADRA